jgi:hypothetical protein
MIRCSLPSSEHREAERGFSLRIAGPKRADMARAAESASKDCSTPLALYLSTKLPSLGIWSAPTVGANAENASLAMFRWRTWKLGVDTSVGAARRVAVGVGDR